MNKVKYESDRRHQFPFTFHIEIKKILSAGFLKRIMIVRENQIFVFFTDFHIRVSLFYCWFLSHLCCRLTARCSESESAGQKMQRSIVNISFSLLLLPCLYFSSEAWKWSRFEAKTVESCSFCVLRALEQPHSAWSCQTSTPPHQTNRRRSSFAC